MSGAASCSDEFDVARNVQVEPVRLDLIEARHVADAGDLGAGSVEVEDPADVALAQLGSARLDEHLRGVGELHVPFRAALLEDHDDRGDAGAVEDVGGKPDDGVDVALVQQPLADLRLLAAAEEHAVGQDDRHNAAGKQVVEVVQQEGVIRLALRGLAVIVEAGVVLGLHPLLRIGGLDAQALTRRWSSESFSSGQSSASVSAFLVRMFEGLTPRMTRFMRVRL